MTDRYSPSGKIPLSVGARGGGRTLSSLLRFRNSGADTARLTLGIQSLLPCRGMRLIMTAERITIANFTAVRANPMSGFGGRHKRLLGKSARLRKVRTRDSA